MCIVSVLIFGIDVLYCASNIATAPTIDQKIEMYEEENAAIEEEVNLVVTAYMEYENKTLGQFKDADPMTLITIFPELKSDSLVVSQIELFKSNTEQIKQLKKDKINLAKAKWRLYFGK